MTEAALAMLAGDPRRVDKANAALKSVRIADAISEVDAEIERVRQASGLTPVRKAAAIGTLERKRVALVEQVVLGTDR
jgi:hypothetical protein